MAREESPREDLLREAIALVERIELAPANAAGHEHVVAGFRREGGLSIYFGSDPAYHFNSRGELRRAFCGGLLIKAERGNLVSLDRRRETDEVQLVSHSLANAEQNEFIVELTRRLDEFAQQCDASAWVTIGRVPADIDVLGRVRDWLAERRAMVIASSPNAV
jgi:predicted urease superfamily metal-dependent hydrolase